MYTNILKIRFNHHANVSVLAINRHNILVNYLCPQCRPRNFCKRKKKSKTSIFFMMEEKFQIFLANVYRIVWFEMAQVQDSSGNDYLKTNRNTVY